MDSFSLLLGSNAFWTGLTFGFVATLLLVALVLAFMAWYDSRFPLEATPCRPAPIAAGIRRARPSPDASPVHVWPGRRGRDL